MNKRFTPEQLDVIQWEFDRHVAAANARTEELEQMYEIVRRQRNNVNVRADAAERDRDSWRRTTETMTLERDQLAARVRELEEQHDRDVDALAKATRHEDAANARADAATKKSNDQKSRSKK
jgi:hypothetical protein